jgi:hypothetical protein
VSCELIYLTSCIASVYIAEAMLVVSPFVCMFVCMSPTKLELSRRDGLRSNFAQLCDAMMQHGEVVMARFLVLSRCVLRSPTYVH